MKSIQREYFDWMYKIIAPKGAVSYYDILTFLHNKEFTYENPSDENRYVDGVNLRRSFAYAKGFDHTDDIFDILTGPCSMFEMLTALAMRIEGSIMDNPAYGDRTKHWFWTMVRNMGLGVAYDGQFDKERAEVMIDRFLRRDYLPNGEGGLFTIKGYREDIRDLEIWHQCMLYLNTIS